MPQPAEVQATADELLDLFRVAQADIQAQLEQLASEGERVARRRARLRQLDQSISGLTEQLERDARTWIERRLPATYELGAETAAAELGEVFAWTQPHLQAVQDLATSTFESVLAATSFVRDSAKRWVRQEARRQTTLSLLEGRTAQQAARALVSAAGEAAEALGGPVGMVRYADGSYRRLADYADTLLRTTTANAYNGGSLNQFRQMGVGWVEVLDGADCGWTGHDDPDKANATVRSVDDAGEHSLSHPRCRRSFVGRPDVANVGQARLAVPSTTAAQRADQAAVEAERAETFRRRRAARQRREGRTATRTPRTARTAT